MRVLLDRPPFAALQTEDFWKGHPWPARWVHVPGAPQPPVVVAFRLRFNLPGQRTVRLHVSADERYELYLNGQRLGRGPERGDVDHWFFETYDLPLTAGAHTLVARVWALGAIAPYAQLSAGLGFVLAAEDADLAALLNTGVAPWESQLLSGYLFPPEGFYCIGPMMTIDAAAFPWGCECGAGDGWRPVRNGVGAYGLTHGWGENPSNHSLLPALLPPLVSLPIAGATVRFAGPITTADVDRQALLAADHRPAWAEQWQALLAGRSAVEVPAQTRLRVVLDLGDYFCAYSALVVSLGHGARIRLRWVESLFYVPGVSPTLPEIDLVSARPRQPQEPYKGDRAQVEGKCLQTSFADTFLPDGQPQRRFEPLWWRSGRYVELLVETAAQPLTIHSLLLTETRYPLDNEATFDSSEPRLRDVARIGFHTLQMCSHETYMDCPHYEQLMYVGDTRLEVLTTFVTTHDDRLPRKALLAFDWSRRSTGLTQARYPNRLTQLIPPFALWWVLMAHDRALWRGDQATIRALLPGIRAVLDAFQGWRNDAGLVFAPPAWNFVDWVPGWPHGTPPEGQSGASASINWQYVLALLAAQELEAWCGDADLAQYHGRLARELALRLERHFWRPRRGLYADDLAGQNFSQHSQCLAVISGLLGADRERALVDTMLQTADLAATTVYFRHYLFEACRRAGRSDAILAGLDIWFDFLKLHCVTTLESPEPTRSDCHAWGAHPLYHYFASLLGIRPASFGFDQIVIQPCLGPLTRAHGAMVHPRGMIEMAIERRGDRWSGHVILPPQTSGRLVLSDGVQPLHPGRLDF